MNWLNLFLQSKAAKASSLAIGSGGALAIILNMIDSRDHNIREFVELKNENIMTRIKDVEKRLDQKLDSNKELLIRIDNRLYELNKKREK